MFCDCSCGSVVAAVVDFSAEAAATAVIPSPELSTHNGRLELVEAAELNGFGDLVGLLCVVGNTNELACSLIISLLSYDLKNFTSSGAACSKDGSRSPGRWIP